MDKEFQIESLIIVAAVAMTLMVPFIIFLGFLFRNRQLKNIREKDRREAEYQKEILRSQIEIQRVTLQNVADEIHDNVGQMIAIVKMKLNIIEEHHIPSPHQNTIMDVNNMMSRISIDLRNLAKGLNPEILQTFGLIECVRFDLERFRNVPGLKIKFLVSGQSISLGISREFVLYRVIQECFANIVKHANAKVINVLFDFTEQSLEIKIEDDGIGFAKEQNSLVALAISGSGLNNMSKRIQLIGGIISIDSKLRLGTIVDIRVPLTL